MKKMILQFCRYLLPSAPAAALLSGCAFTNPPPLPLENPTNPEVAGSGAPPKSLLVADATTKAISERLRQVPAAAELPAMEHGGMEHGGMHDEGTKPQEQRQSGEASEEQQKPGGVYICPMHPEVTSDKPGNCPKCGMKLVEKGGGHEDY
jgi:Heavy metal binding domain